MFYEEVGKIVVNPGLDNNPYNYPFGSWLFIAVIAKITGLDLILTAYIFSALYIIVIISVFYNYSDLFLKHREQKTFAVLFLLSMPIFAISLETIRPSIFVIPFLLYAVYYSYSENFNYKSAATIIISEIVIVLSHTGTFIYMMIFDMLLFLIFCLIYGKFVRSLYFMLASSFFIYWGTVKLFPHLLPQYAAKSSLFLTPGNFIATKFHIFFADDLSYVLYNNMFVNHEFTSAIIWAALFFALGQFLLHINKKIAGKYSSIYTENKYALIPANISHSFILTPFWIGIIQTVFAIAGFFCLDKKGKCFMLAVIVTTIIPAYLNESEGISGSTGALREIYYLLLIIPVVAVLGLWKISRYLKGKRTPGRVIFFILILIVSLTIIITPLLGNGYYNYQISGDDYIIDGMSWLSGTGNSNEKAVGFGYRNVPIFTGKLDSNYGIISGSQTRNFIETLKRVYFIKDGDQAMDHYSVFGTKYFLLSNKLISNLNGNIDEVKTDYNSDLDRIYSSKDFGIYGLIIPANKTATIQSDNNDLDIEEIGSNFDITTDGYKILLDKSTPTIKYIGNSFQNYLQEGTISEKVIFSFPTRDNKLSNVYHLFNQDNEYSTEIRDNQIIYNTNIDNGKNEIVSTAEIRYTFYPETIKREYIISNDYIPDTEDIPMIIHFTSNVFSPSDKFAYFSNNNRYEKSIYPSEDYIELSEIFDKVYISDGSDGLYINYEKTSTYPNKLYYKGNTAHDYSNVIMEQSEIIEPGASIHISQFISTGSEINAEMKINDQNRVALHPYPEGIIPLIFCNYNSGTVLAGPGKTKSIAIENKSLELTDTYGNTANEITLESLKQYSESNTPYLTSVIINAPYLSQVYEEGLRHPQILKIYGEDKETVILPVSRPLGVLQKDENEIISLFEDCKNVVRSVSENNDMALFLIDINGIRNENNSREFLGLLEYADKQGLEFSSPDEIAEHYRLIRKIKYSSAQEIDKVTLSIINNNDDPVSGLTFRIKMPVLDSGDYITDSGSIVKRVILNDHEIIYLSVDLKPKESDNVTIMPDVKKKKILVEMPGSPGEGEIEIKLKDEYGNILKKTAAKIDSVTYQTDENGIISVFLRRGEHSIEIESPGCIKYYSEFEVYNRIYALKGIFET